MTDVYVNCFRKTAQYTLLATYEIKLYLKETKGQAVMGTLTLQWGWS